MAKHILIAIILSSGLPIWLYAQEVTGIWFSADKTRTYLISNVNGTLHASIQQSGRKNDQVKDTILSNMLIHSKAGVYTGTIHSTHDQSRRSVKIRLNKNGQRLTLRIPRFYLFPVIIYWYR